MSSSVIELQKELLSSDQKVSDLLRKAYVLARKLRVKDFELWLHDELNGYRDSATIPSYRSMTGMLKGWNAYNGWIPVIIDDVKSQMSLSQINNNQGVPELEELLLNSKEGIHAPLPDSFSQLTGHRTKYKLELSAVQVQSIIAIVKNIILEWLLKLEEDGILGENMSFTEKEKEIAERGNYTVNNFYGDVSGSQIQQGSTNSAQNMSAEKFDLDLVKEIVSIIKENVPSLSLDEKNKMEVLDTARAIEMEVASMKPKKNVVLAGFHTIRNILEGAAGSIVASGILYKLNLFQ